MPTFGASQTERIAGGLYNDILAGILLGEYPPQSALPAENRLASDSGISRAVVRSALDRLKRSGVVESRQGSGTVVSEFDPQTLAQLNRDAQLPELRDCFECRAGVEPEIAAIVAANLSKSARDFLEDQRQSLKEDDEGTEYERSVSDAQFHICLADFSRNSFFVSIMNQLRPHMLFAMNITKTLTKRAHDNHVNLSRHEHLDVIDAVLDQDSEAARKAMRTHIERGAQRIFADET